MKLKTQNIKLALAVFILLSTFNFLLSDDTFAAQDSGIYTYVFHLYSDKGKLIVDRDFKTPFDLIAEGYRQIVHDKWDFRVEIKSIRGENLGGFQVFSDFQENKTAGKITARAPYFDNAKTAVFYDLNNAKVLEIDLAPGGPVCNEDGVCGADTGENSQNCPGDCKVTPTTTITPKPQSSLLGRIFSLTNLLGLIIAAILIFLFRWLKRKKQNVLPPQI